MTDVVIEVGSMTVSVSSCVAACTAMARGSSKRFMLQEIEEAEARAEAIKFKRNGERPVGWKEPEPPKSKQPLSIAGAASSDPRITAEVHADGQSATFTLPHPPSRAWMSKDVPVMSKRKDDVRPEHALAFFSEWRDAPPRGSNMTPRELLYWAWSHGASQNVLAHVVATGESVGWDEGRSWAGGSAPVRMFCQMAVQDASAEVEKARRGKTGQPDYQEMLKLREMELRAQSSVEAVMAKTRELNNQMRASNGLPAVAYAKVKSGEALTQEQASQYADYLRATGQSVAEHLAAWSGPDIPVSFPWSTEGAAYGAGHTLTFSVPPLHPESCTCQACWSSGRRPRA